jgi:peptidoglycan hydrolase CwlO-like protein
VFAVRCRLISGYEWLRIGIRKCHLRQAGQQPPHLDDAATAAEGCQNVVDAAKAEAEAALEKYQQERESNQMLSSRTDELECDLARRREEIRMVDDARRRLSDQLELERAARIKAETELGSVLTAALTSDEAHAAREKSSTELVQRREEEIEALRHELKGVRDELERVQAETNEHAASVTRLDGIVAEQAEQIVQLRATVDALTEERDSIAKTNATAVQGEADRAGQLSEAKAELQRVAKEGEEKYSQIVAERDDLQDQVRRLTDEVSNIKIQRDALLLIAKEDRSTPSLTPRATPRLTPSQTPAVAPPTLPTEHTPEPPEPPASGPVSDDASHRDPLSNRSLSLAQPTDGDDSSAHFGFATSLHQVDVAALRRKHTTHQRVDQEKFFADVFEQLRLLQRPLRFTIETTRSLVGGRSSTLVANRSSYKIVAEIGKGHRQAMEQATKEGYIFGEVVAITDIAADDKSIKGHVSFQIKQH